jgi:hypothetical protein
MMDDRVLRAICQRLAALPCCDLCDEPETDARPLVVTPDGPMHGDCWNSELCARCGHENGSHTRRGCLIINCDCGREEAAR